MRPLWAIERAVIEGAAQDYGQSAELLKQQMEAAQISKFENTGGGFFSTVTVLPDAPQISERSPMDAAHGTVSGMEYGMGFLVFLEDGRVSLIEGYSQGGDSTADIDFEHVQFDLKPWGNRGDT